MAILLMEGFDVSDGYSTGDTNKNPDFTYFTVNTVDTRLSSVRGLSGGRALKIGVEDLAEAAIVANYPAAQNLVVGFSIAFSLESINSFSTLTYFFKIRSSGGAWIKLHKPGGLDEKIELESSTGGSIVFDQAVSTSQTYYFEIELLNGTVNLYVNNVLIGSTTTTTTDFSEVYIGMKEAGNSNYLVYATYDDFYLIDDTGPDFDSRLGPISIVPLLPTADGSVGNDFATSPASGDAFDKIDDDADSVWTDEDTTYIESFSAGATQTVTCTAKTNFTGEALGVIAASSVKADSPSQNLARVLVSSGGSETEGVAQAIPVGQYEPIRLAAITALPDGGQLTQANLEAAEFGIRLFRP